MFTYDEETDYWLTNEEWYEILGFDINGDTIFCLTDKAPQKARESFKRYQNEPIRTCQDAAHADEWETAGLENMEKFIKWKKAGYPPLERYLETHSLQKLSHCELCLTVMADTRVRGRTNVI